MAAILASFDKNKRKHTNPFISAIKAFGKKKEKSNEEKVFCWNKLFWLPKCKDYGRLAEQFDQLVDNEKQFLVFC